MCLQEATTGIINIEGFDPETVARMVSFLYTGKYECKEGQMEGKPSPWMLAFFDI
jgi:hypothetical protein